MARGMSQRHNVFAVVNGAKFRNFLLLRRNGEKTVSLFLQNDANLAVSYGGVPAVVARIIIGFTANV